MRCMSDLGEITALVHSYALLLDQGNMDGVTALFAHSTWHSEPAEVVVSGSEQVLQGSEAVKPVYAGIKLYGGTPRTKHLITNLTVDVEPGASTASSQCYWTVIQGIVPGEPINVILSGQYIDEFHKVDGAWCFADRLIRVDLSGDSSKHV